MLARPLLLILNVMFCAFLVDINHYSLYSLYSESKGIILNSQNEFISYAHLYLKDSETGIVANYDGEFLIPDSWPDNGTVVISAIGYNNKSLSVAELRTCLARNSPVILSSIDYGLGELTVSASKLKEGTVRNYGFLRRVLGYGGSVGGFSTPENRVAHSRAQRIDVDREPPIWLSSITIWVDITGNKTYRNPENREFDESDFSKEALIRISLVDLAEDGSPGENSYLPEPIYILIDRNGPRQEIDLNSYSLKMNESQFYIVYEFIVDAPDFYYGYMPMFTVGGRGDGSYYRHSPFRPWTEYHGLQMMYKAEYLY